MESALTPRFRVSDFLAVVNQSLEVAFGSIEVEGEVASFKVNHQKYVFFDLKDAGGSVGCFMSAWQLRTPLEDGMRVVVRAIPKVTTWGKFSLTVQAVHPVGEGSLKKSFELLKAKLANEGLFDVARKRPLPAFPARVMVISSVQAAGYADFMKIAAQRTGGVKFIVANVQVQGASAPDQIIRAIDYANQLPELPDVIVVLRGGGSADDLSAFNDELLVRAIAASRVPVLTGIGHETDESLSDLVADRSAVTPSHAAQVVLPDRKALIDRLRADREALLAVCEQRLSERMAVVDDARQGALEVWANDVAQRLEGIRARREALRAYDPELVLRQGYALITGEAKLDSIVKITTKEAYMKARIEEYVKR